MPPRTGPRGSSSRGGPFRGGAVARRDPNTIQVGLPSSDSHVTTIGVKRPNAGTAGQPSEIFVNSFKTTIPDGIIHHYDVIAPIDKPLPTRMNMDLIQQLQTVVAPQIFTPRAVYDGRRNLFAVRELPFGDSGFQHFDVSFAVIPADVRARAPKIYNIRVAKVAEINPEVLKRFIAGNQSHDNTVLTAITALNVVIRMEPTMNYPFNVRSFFTDRETKDIGAGLQLWRGYFQSVRPGIGQMLINVDISTSTMYKAGPLLQICLEYLQKTDPNSLAPKRGLPDRERMRLQRFISGIRVLTTNLGQGGTVQRTPRVVKKLSTIGAGALTFKMREGDIMTVADYFRKTQNRALQYPDVICVEVGSGALIPLELCMVPPGQIMRKQVPPEKTKDILDFATMKPQARLASINNGLSVLAYGQSEYVRQFGMTVDHAAGPLKVSARILKPPMLLYGAGSKDARITPYNGSWNMIDKRFFKAVTIEHWLVVIYEMQRRFPENAARDMITGLVQSCRKVGIKINETGMIWWENGNGVVANQLRSAGSEYAKTHKGIPPTLIVVILPEGGNEIYTAVKHFGDVTMGVATQCLKSSKCFKAKPQYYANVSLKINVKLGGINTIPEPRSVMALTDPQNPTIVMGADVIHPPSGSDGRPSFAALVASVDSDTAKYIADSRVQASRQEMIEDLQAMSKHVLSMYMRYREKAERKTTIAPTRIIFYRDGVSEGQFKQVLRIELPQLRRACEELGIKPKITIIVVGKRHHVRFFPRTEAGTDKSGNCKAGTVVDTEVAHPTEFDFYLQSHGGLLGTSRPAHYSVLYDENNFSLNIHFPLSEQVLIHMTSLVLMLSSLCPSPCVMYTRVRRARSPYPPLCTMLISSAPARKITMTPLASTFRILPRRPMPAKLIRLSKSLKTPSSLCTKFRPLSCTSRNFYNHCAILFCRQDLAPRSSPWLTELYNYCHCHCYCCHSCPVFQVLLYLHSLCQPRQPFIILLYCCGPVRYQACTCCVVKRVAC